MNRIIHGAVTLLIAGTLSCTHWRAQYLDQVLDHAAQDDVAQRFGRPNEGNSLGDGTTMWVYQTIGKTAPPPKGRGEPYCTEYRLFFGEDKILRQWDAHRC